MRLALLVALASCGKDHFDHAHNYAFVTSQVFDPSTFGADLAVADQHCRDAAANADLLGDYVAYLATQNINATGRIANARGWLRLDGAPFVDSVDDLANNGPLTPLSIDELGEDIAMGASPIATGALQDGTADRNCNNWTDPTFDFNGGITDATDFDWVHGRPGQCTMQARLYCFGISYDAALESAPATGRRMFVTVQSFLPGGGLAAADALCQSEAQLAGISGTFLALLPTSTAPASARFDLSGPPWVRLDGVAVASSALAFMGGDLVTSPNVTSLGQYTNSVVLTAGPLTTVPTNGTCMDWTTTAAQIPGGGVSNRTDGLAFVGATSAGCNGAPIYCLEP